jgi:hypothetical protein
LVTERLVFKVTPVQYPTGTPAEAWLGNPQNQFFGITEVRSVGNVPGESPAAGTERCYRPFSGRIPWRRVKALTVKTTHIARAFHVFAATIMGNNAHKVVPM